MNRRLLVGTRRTFLAGAIAAVALPRVAIANDEFRSDWFGFGTEVKASWRIEGMANDIMRVVIRPKWLAEEHVKRRIVVLYPRASSAYNVAITEILHVFEDKQIDVEFHVINFDRKDDRGMASIRTAEAMNASMIISMGSESTAWLWDNYRNGQLPVVTVCSKDPVTLGQAANYESGSGNNFAFTSLNMPIDSQMTYILDLMPELKNIGILVDKTNVSAMETQAKPIADYARKKGLRPFMLAISKPENAAAELRTLVREATASMQKSDVDLTQSMFVVTGSTSVFNEIRTINREASRIPVLSLVPEIVQAGDDSAAVSIGISFESNAHLAAVYASEILTNPGAVKTLKVGIVSPPDIAINFKRTRAIGLKVPFSFFEAASTIYDPSGKLARSPSVLVSAKQ